MRFLCAVEAFQKIKPELTALRELARQRRSASLKQQMTKLAQLREIEGNINYLRKKKIGPVELVD